MSLPSDTPQGIADTLGYLQHHLQELTERQHVSESNINFTLVALTTQLQQLTQLVANPLPPAVPNTPPSPVPSPLVSPPPAPPVRWGVMDMPQALLPPRLQWRTSQWPHIPELLLPLYTPSPGAVPQRTGKDSLGSHVLQRRSCCQVVRKRILSRSGHWRFPHPNLERL